MTQEELAKTLDMDNSYVSLLERGARIPSLPTLNKIAGVFGVRIHDMLTEDAEVEEDFVKRELEYIIGVFPSEDIDKIHTIMKILGAPEKNK